MLHAVRAFLCTTIAQPHRIRKMLGHLLRRASHATSIQQSPTSISTLSCSLCLALLLPRLFILIASTGRQVGAELQSGSRALLAFVWCLPWIDPKISSKTIQPTVSRHLVVELHLHLHYNRGGIILRHLHHITSTTTSTHLHLMT
jgi:hypothetical protein